MTADATGRCPDCGGVTDAGEERCPACEEAGRPVRNILDFEGALPNLTGGMAPEDYVRMLRGGWPDDDEPGMGWRDLQRALNRGTRRR